MTSTDPLGIYTLNCRLQPEGTRAHTRTEHTHTQTHTHTTAHYGCTRLSMNVIPFSLIEKTHKQRHKDINTIITPAQVVLSTLPQDKGATCSSIKF